MSANSAWEALMAAHATLTREFAAQDTWQELSRREYDAVYTLSKCPAPISVSELHRHVLLSQPALSRLVDRLVDRGLVRRSTDPGDGRVVLVSLTDHGRDAQRHVGRQHARNVARAVTSRLSSEEQGQLEALCRKLARRTTA
ncbi:MarR family transcriptional regulator [Longispora sp. K20-0274]|uniref:MarR family winged helix-turn-helix transcriptional regulator n=1 Tax=Longispora sp. K20-0274 TaxID=3088255 RepID=UPI003999831D